MYWESNHVEIGTIKLQNFVAMVRPNRRRFTEILMSWWSSKNALVKLSQNELSELIKNKQFLIVGGTAGIGRALAISLLQRGAQVTVVGRRQPDQALAQAKFVSKDLSLMKNAQALAKEIPLNKLDVIVFTNGIIPTTDRVETAEKVEIDMAVSYLSRFVFWNAAAASFSQNRSTKPRVFVMGYPGQNMKSDISDLNSEKEYKAFPAHEKTVIANEALVTYLAENKSINAYGLNPGLIFTEIRDRLLGKGSWASFIVESMIKLFCQSAEQYAENTLVHLMVSPQLEDASGRLFYSKGSTIGPNPSLSLEKQKQVIEESKKLAERALAA